MNSIGRIEIFIEVARQQSFAKAAKSLGLTGPAASKQVMALEAELGVKLLHRTTRLVTLTDEGALYYERARLALDELKEAAAQIQDLKETPKGVLKISAPVIFGHMHLLHVLSSFAKKYPDLQLDVSFDERTVDVVAEGFDLVLRIGVPQDSTLITRHISNCPIIMVAAPSYIKEYGEPRTPQDLKSHRAIIRLNAGNAFEWRYKDKGGKTGMVKLEGAFRANTAEMVLTAALEGVGIAVLPYFIISNHIKAGQLIELLPSYKTYPERQLTALMPPNRYRSAKVKLLLDWIFQACKAMPLDR